MFEDLDIKTEELNGALDNVYSTTIDTGEVNQLLQEMRDAHGMEVGGELAGAGTGNVKSAQKDNDV